MNTVHANPCLRLLAVIAATVLLQGCGGGDSGYGGSKPDENPGLPPSVSLAPADLGDGWTLSTPGAEGLDPDAIGAILESIRDGRYPGVDSMLVVKNQRLVAEGYFNGFGPDSLHDLRSTGKSVTAALVGIAIEDGQLDLDDPVSQHLPDFESYAHMDDRKRAITLRHLLHMSSGLDCNDWIDSSAGNEERMYGTRDWIRFVMDLRMLVAPGTGTSYCTGGVVVLGHIVSLRSGMALDDYAQANLFAPLGIQQSNWRRSPDGKATGGGGLRLRPRDAAKFGALFVNEGVWNGTRVVPESWVLATRERVTFLGRDGYGFLWWKRGFPIGATIVDSSFTSGNGGNYIFTFPDLELVVVFTGSNYNDPKGDQPFGIVPAVLAALRPGDSASP